MLTKDYKIKAQAQIFKALGHPSRLRMVDFLREGEKCVCELQALIGDDISTVSRHLKILKEANIVNSEKKGVNIYYSLKLSCLSTFLACTQASIEEDIHNSILIKIK